MQRRPRPVVVSLGVVLGLVATMAITVVTAGAARATTVPAAATAINGYALVDSAGHLYSHGAAPGGYAVPTGLSGPVVGEAATPDGRGFYLVTSTGDVRAYGDAVAQGSESGAHLNQPIVGMTVDPATGGYWLVASDGGIFAFNAPFYGSEGGTGLTSPIVGMTATATAAASGLAVTTSALPPGTVGDAYSQTVLGAAGGTCPCTWKATGLPGGLSLSQAGILSGTPTAAGPVTITVTVTDSTGATASHPLPLTVDPAATAIAGVAGLSEVDSIVTGPDGNLWFTTYSGGVGRITTSGTITMFASAALMHPESIVAGNADDLWVADFDGAIAHVTATGQITSFTSPIGATSLALGPDGNLWFTSFAANEVGRMTPTGTFTVYDDPTISGPTAITAGPDGALWFTNYSNGSGGTDGSTIGRITTSGQVGVYRNPQISGPASITAGPDGALWFTSAGEIGRLSTLGTFTFYSGPDVADPTSLINGPDGALWYLDNPTSGPALLGRITTAGVASTVPMATFDAADQKPGVGAADPESLTSGPDGDFWVGGWNVIGRVTTTGSSTAFARPGLSAPTGITTGGDGNLWVTDDSPMSIDRITPQGGLASFTLPDTSDEPEDPARGPDGAVWFVQGDRLGRIAADGTVSYVAPPTGTSGLGGLVAGPQDALWFTWAGPGSASGIGRVTTAGQVTLFPAAAGTDPTELVAAPDGRLWFIGHDSIIGRMTSAGIYQTVPQPTGGDPTALTVGPDGALWFANSYGTGTGWEAGRLTTAGQYSYLYNGGYSDEPGYDQIAFAGDATLWYLKLNATIGRFGPTTGTPVNSTDEHTEYATEMTTGPDGAIWYLKESYVGRLTAANLPAS